MFRNKYNSLIQLTRHNAPLNDYTKILDETKNVDVLIHAAFDNRYRHNIIGIKNILNACKNNNIKKLIYLSTISVYDLNRPSIVDENVVYTKIKAPYCREKIKIEQIIEKYRNSNSFKNNKFEIIIIQPSIVFGYGGNWSDYAFNVCNSKGIKLPNTGDIICNAIYVKDVVSLIEKCCSEHLMSGKYLITGNQSLTWREFYNGHSNFLSEINIQNRLRILNDNTTYSYHPFYLFNMLYLIWYRTPAHFIINYLLKVLQLVTELLRDNGNSEYILDKNSNNKIFTPSGISRVMHKSNFIINIKKAGKEIKFKPQFNFTKGINDMVKEYGG